MNLYTVKVITQTGTSHLTNLSLMPHEANASNIHEILTNRFGQLKTIDELSFVCSL